MTMRATATADATAIIIITVDEILELSVAKLTVKSISLKLSLFSYN